MRFVLPALLLAPLALQSQTLQSIRTLHGNLADNVTAMTKDPQGNTILVGNTTSTDFPTKNALQTKLKAFQDTFVTKVDSSGSIVFSTYVGGSNDDYATAVAVDPASNIYITGYTFSKDFPAVAALSS